MTGGSVAWGLLTTARVNRLVLAGASESEQGGVVAFGSRERGRAEIYAQEHGIEYACGSYEELIVQREVEAVYVRRKGVSRDVSASR